VLEGKALAEFNLPITVRIIVCAMMNSFTYFFFFVFLYFLFLIFNFFFFFSSDFCIYIFLIVGEKDSYNVAELAWRYRKQGIVAFDAAGPEKGYSSVIHKRAFELIRRHGLNCTIHSGEAAGWESVRDSIRYCGAHRLVLF
jgi:hypothetical protein